MVEEGLILPVVSIITPVYNAALWLPETLDCVRAQTFTDWEHILVDDGSTDDSVAIIEAAVREDKRFRLIRTPHNSGPSNARNLALEAACGRYIALLDADDLWLEKKLELSVEWLQLHQHAFVYHDYRHMSLDGTQVGPRIHAPEVLDLRALHTRRGHGGCMSFVLDRERTGEFRFPVSCEYLHEDFCAWLGLIQRGLTGGRLAEDLGLYRVSQASRSGNKMKSIRETWRIYRRLSKLSRVQAAIWWTEYVWNSFWLHRYANPRLKVSRAAVTAPLMKFRSEASSEATSVPGGRVPHQP